MTHKLSTLLFSLKLAIVLSSTVLQLAWLKTPFFVRFFGLYTLICVFVTGLVIITVPAQSQIQTISTLPPVETSLLQTTTVNKETLQEKHEFYLKLLDKQPQHRDSLINAALTAYALGDVEAFSEYWNKAKAVDPNNPIFN